MRRVHGQLRPSTTSAEVLFNPTANLPYTMDLIIGTNSSGGSVDVTIYHDPDGTTYDATTEVMATRTLADGETLEFAPEGGLSDYQSAGNIAVKTSVVDTINFTIYGVVDGEIIT